MASYVVMERMPVSGTRPETVFVRDEFSFLALVFPLVWLLWYRLWFAALMLFLLSGALGLVGEFLAPGAAIGFAGIVVSFFVALEGPSWRIARYRRDGYVDAGTIVAPGLEEAELRWFAGHGAQKPAEPVRPAALKADPAPPPLPPQSDMLFGFNETGR
jgi:hypothetical protein